IAPYLIKRNLPEFLEQKLQRRASLQEIVINPFLLTVDLKGFAIQQKKGAARFAGFDEFFVDLEWASIPAKAVLVDQAALRGLVVDVDRFKDGTFNFDDLLIPADPKKGQAKDNSPLLPVSIKQIEIHKAQMLLEDRSRKSPFRSRFAPIDLSISDFQTDPGQESQGQFKAELEGGGKIEWLGDISIAPFRSKGRIELSGFRAGLAWQAFQDLVNFEITDGLLNLNASYELYYKKDALQVKVSQAQSSLDRLKLIRKGDPQPLIDIPRFKLDGITFDLIGQKLAIASLSSEKAKIHAWVRKDKEINLIDLFVPAPGPKPASVSSRIPQAAPNDSKWLFTIGNIALNDYAFLFEDRSLATPLSLNFEPLDITLENFSSDRIGKL
ncbi:MAG: DUF748 domain-containing protein, partial [Methylococcales bacterium]